MRAHTSSYVMPYVRVPMHTFCWLVLGATGCQLLRLLGLLNVPLMRLYG
jgi:hypothetical protein